MPYATPLMRHRRQELGIKLQDFYRRVGVSYGHYRNVEYGTHPAAIEVFHRIARELAVPVNDLIAKDEPDQGDPQQDEHVSPEPLPPSKPAGPTRPPNRPKVSAA